MDGIVPFSGTSLRDGLLRYMTFSSLQNELTKKLIHKIKMIAQWD